MFFSDDMKDLITLFEKNSVQYLLVGGFAVNYYGYVRTTMDIDILVFPSKENANQIILALKEFGFGATEIPPDYFSKEGCAIHLGVEPNRIDILTKLKDISNSQIFNNSQKIQYDGLELNIISKEDLLECKKKSSRLKDLADAEELEKLK